MDADRNETQPLRICSFVVGSKHHEHFPLALVLQLIYHFQLVDYVTAMTKEMLFSSITKFNFKVYVNRKQVSIRTVKNWHKLLNYSKRQAINFPS